MGVRYFLLIVILVLLGGCGGDGGSIPIASVDRNGYTTVNNNQLSVQLTNLPVGTLSAEETAGILLMREEEKLARDVYRSLANLFSLPIFDNIADSEETHMQAMLLLVQRYNLTDPVGSQGIGSFTDPQLQQLYVQLVDEGSTDVVAALSIGARIEELDIADISRLETQLEDNADIALVYDNLKRGSRNHLRAFYQQIVSNGGSYTPVYLSADEFNAIINSDIERG